MSSVYLGQADLTTDPFFNRRVAACIQKEVGAWSTPPTKPVAEIVSEIIAKVAAAPTFDQKYIWGNQAEGLPPGHMGISDLEILNVVQPMLDAYRAST